MNILVEGKFGHGGHVDSYDNRDYKWKEVAGAPIPFDWQTGFDIEKKLGQKIPVKDQGSSYSCGGQAWGYLAEVLEALNTGSFEERSAKYIYAQTHVPGGGSMGRDNANLFCKQGVCRESLLPSYPNTEENLTRSYDIIDIEREDAKTDLSLSYAQTELNIDDIALAMKNNNGVILGIEGQNNGTWLSPYPRPPINVEWRHWIFAGKAKIKDGIKYIGVLNSWGKDVGENGWQWLSEDYFTTSHVFSGWTHVIKPFIGSFDKDLYYMTEGNEIKRLQSFLKQLGYFTGQETGYYGDLTRKAVFAFQREYVNLTPWEYFIRRGNLVGPKTRLALNIIIAKKVVQT